MSALLALVPLKDWIYAGVIAALLAGFGWYTVHERHAGEQKVEAADAKAVAAQTKANAEKESYAQSQIAKALADYKASVAAPVAGPVPQLVCRNAARGSGNVPNNAGASGGSNDGSAVPEPSDGPPFDPAPAVIADGRDADAQIALLQKYIATCQAAGLCQK